MALFRGGFIACIVLAGAVFAGTPGLCFVGQAVAQGSAAPVSPVKPAQTVAQKIAASQGLLDINAATPDQLKALPGMGDAYVKRIVDGRPYTAKNQLVTRGVIPQPAYEKVKDQIIAHRPKP
jgi:competence protein ComEA